MARFVNIVIPVHNNYEATSRILEDLEAQTLRDFRVVVFDDGSSDQTSRLASAGNLTVIRGNGNCWWTRSVNEGVRYVLKHFTPDPADLIVFLNNDVRLPADYLATLVGHANDFPDAAIGTVIHDFNGRLISIGPKIDVARFRITDLIDGGTDSTGQDRFFPDALSGRGVAYPVDMILKAGLPDEKRFPHYYADYAYSIHVCQAGYRLMLFKDLFLYSEDSFGSQKKLKGWIRQYFSRYSPSNLPQYYRFWQLNAGSLFQRLVLPLRFLGYLGYKTLNKG